MNNIKQWLTHKWVIIGAVAIAVIAVTAIVTAVVINLSSDDQAAPANTTADATAPSAKEPTPTNKTCVGDDCLAVDGLEYPAGQLPAAVSAAVKAALDDEYKAYSTYDAVIAKLGAVRPFSMIIRAEESHIASLKAVLDKYGEQIPTNPYDGKTTAAATKQANCQVGVDAEVANVALYRDDLLNKVKNYPDITAVFTNLMNASNDKHLPAFQKCN